MSSHAQCLARPNDSSKHAVPVIVTLCGGERRASGPASDLAGTVDGGRVGYVADTVDSGSARTERIAVAEVQRAVVAELGWSFREQPKADYGIDAQVELVDRGIVIPHLLAVQIKGGASRFRDPGPGGWWFRPLDRHVRYWLSHALPVIVVLVDTESGMAYWQVITSQTVAATSQGGWKVLVPESQRLDAYARAALTEVAAGDPYVYGCGNFSWRAR